MKWARLAAVFSMLLVYSLFASARESVPVVDHIDVPVMTSKGSSVSIEQVRDAITVAAIAQHWEIIKSPTENVLSATLKVRGKHTAVVSIPYSADKYSIKYQNSVNLGYGISDVSAADPANVYGMNAPSKKLKQGVPLIHPFYNKWVQSLLLAVQLEVKKL